jgi:2-keto-4-pentenoate hydratase
MRSAMPAPRMPPEMIAGQRSLFAQMRRREATTQHRRVGWKIGGAIQEIDALGAELPAVGWLSSQTVLADGDGYAARGAKALRGETELVVELAQAIARDADDATVRNAISGLRVALEIVDVRRPRRDARRIIEGNLFHRAVIFGTHLGDLTDDVGRATLSINGLVHHQAVERPQPLSTVRDVARTLAASGATLAARDKILCGALVHVPVSVGDELLAEIDGLGHARACIRK